MKASPLPRLDARWLVDRNSVVYRCLTPDPAQALLFGNGNVGGSVHTPDDSIYILVSRSDLWNEQGNMGSIAAVRIRGTPGLFTKARTVRQECNLYEANIRIRVDAVTFTITCLREKDAIVVDIDDKRRKREFTITIENWHDGDETTATETIHVNRSSSFEEMNRRVKVDASKIGLSDPLLGRAWGLFVDHSKPHRIVIATACWAPEAGVDAAEEVRKTGRSFLQHACRSAGAWLKEHQRWWREFWDKSHIALESGTGDAEYEERLWYVNLYYLACAHGGTYPARFNGATFLLDKDSRDWDYGYWFQNMRELYWPLLATGHWEWMRGFFQMYFDALPFVKAQTRSIFGIDAPSFRETQTFWGCSPDTNLVDQKFNAGVHNNFSNNLEVCLLMDWYCRASGEERFLSNDFYPFLRQIVSFFQQYAKKGDDGHWHIAPSNAIEVWPDAKDPMPDIAGLRYLLPRLIEWGRKFGVEAKEIANWQEFLDNLAPIPVGRWTITRKHADGIHAEEWHVASELDPKGLFLPAADKTKEKQLRSNMENAELYIVFPWGMVGMDSPTEELRRFENTWNHRTWKLVNNGWAQDVPQLARMGWSEPARVTSLEHASYNQRFPNGAFISPAGAHFHGLVTNTPYLDSAGVHLMGLNEMLLQSYDGVIRIAPSVSTEWSGQFKMHALDGFVVEASFTHGKPTRTRITATRGGTLRVRNHRSEPMLVGKGETARGELIQKHMKRGELVEISWQGVQATRAGSKQPRPEVVYPGYKVRPPRAAHPTGHWHDERKGHGQIGLAADGLFAATRQK